ncbi:MAG: response regulator transcription factor [Verrucomicrobia bacterium]|nr:response regulator transcription factor [Verrucomicrobiota bacterium]
MNPSPIPIVLIEDNEPYAMALRKFFALPGSAVDCRAIYGTAELALLEIPKKPPSVALVDINLPGTNGIECIARLKESCPDLVCLVLTMYEEDHLIFDALRAGACGYLLKRTPPADIASAIQVASAGGSPMSPHIARQVVGFFHRSPPPKPDRALTSREQEVLNLLIEGKFYKEIANALGVTIDTVRTHIRKIYDKLHIHSRTEIIMKFGQSGR